MSNSSQRPQPLVVTPIGEGPNGSLSKLIIAAGCQVLAELSQLNRKGWEDPVLDVHFRQKWEKISTQLSKPDHEAAIYWLRAYCKTMHYMNRQMNIIPDGPLNFLDLGSAPGGYSKSILETNPNAIGTGISLPINDGGHPWMLPKYLRSRYTIHFADITKYNIQRGGVVGYGRPLPFPPASFDLVIVDGQTLYTREYSVRAPHILAISQIIIALEAVKEGGVAFIKLSKIASPTSASLLYLFDSICTSLETIKPSKVQGSRGTFYAIVRGVRRGETLDGYIDILRQIRQEVLNSNLELDQLKLVYERIVTLAWLKENYIPRLIELGTPVWEVQKECLRTFIQNKGTHKVESDEDKEAPGRESDTTCPVC